MEQNTFWANTKKRLKKKSYQQRIKTAASKVEATQIAANLIWFRNEDNNTIYIPKGRVLMYEKR